MKTEEKVVKSKAELNEGMFCQPEIVYGQETVLENGFYVRKEIAREVRPDEKFKGVKVDDFSINHLSAIGATDMLKDMSGKYGEYGMDAVDAVGSQIENNE